MKNDDIVYSLNVEDIQTVAIEELERELSDDELSKVIELLGERINWYEAVLSSILEVNASKEERE
jgi:hypothetical protein